MYDFAQIMILLLSLIWHAVSPCFSNDFKTNGGRKVKDDPLLKQQYNNVKTVKSKSSAFNVVKYRSTPDQTVHHGVSTYHVKQNCSHIFLTISFLIHTSQSLKKIRDIFMLFIAFCSYLIIQNEMNLLFCNLTQLSILSTIKLYSSWIFFYFKRKRYWQKEEKK